MTDANDRTEDSSRKEESVEELNNASGVLKGEIETNQDSFENQTIEPAQSEVPTSKPLKKRLTLQERLALAAKGIKKPSPKPLVDGEQTQTQAQTQAHAQSTSPVMSPQVTGNQGTNDGDSKYKAEVEKLRLDIANLKKAKPDSFAKERQQFLEKLKTKDETIEQLLKEGESLSRKELVLNESIKKLKLANQTLEEDMAEFAKKHDSVLISSQELQELVKFHKLKNVDQLIEKFSQLNQELIESKKECEGLKHWETRYNELSKQHEELIATRKELTKEVNSLKVEHEMAKKQFELDLELKQDKIIQKK